VSDRIRDIEALRRDHCFDEAWTRLLDVAREEIDASELGALCRLRRRLARESGAPAGGRAVKVALLGGASTEMMEEPLALQIQALGLTPEIHRADYGTFAGEMLDPTSATVAFRPDVAIVVATPANVHAWPEPGDDRDTVRTRVDEVCDHWLSLCASLHEHVGCEIVLDNFHAPTTRALGHLGAKLPWDPLTFLRAVNLELGLRAPDHVHVHDVDALAARHGTLAWFDARYWHHAKQPVSFDCVPRYTQSLARVVAALFGVTRKCLVLDLDNTLWGGVVGDDGVDGIRIGEGDAVGEAFKAFQQYVLELKRRGVLLAVCSKNEDANAREPFEKHPEMVLRLDDFVAFQANWEPKPDNLRAIARQVNIGLDALVFVDDNPVEREHVRQRLPEVRVIELTDDPSDYPVLLDRAGCFEAAALSLEDAARTELYRANAERERQRETAGDYTSYLASLDQVARTRPFLPGDLDRVTQLVNKSNQWNLTTLRLSRSQVEAMAEAPDRIARTVRLRDRFGDNGLIAVFAAERRGDAFEIDLWLMSCRVLKRGVENHLMNHVVEAARALGAQELRGVYIPTAKNVLVRDLYPSLGFRPVEDPVDGDPEGTTRWVLALDEYTPFAVQIEEEPGES
jgi:FkbH-like protein